MNSSRQAVVAALAGGILAGTIDIGAACLISGRSAPFILQGIAGGLLGRASFDGGAATVLLGALLQEFMGILIAAIFVVASRLLPVLRRQWLASGIGYGAIIFVVMNYVVVPLSAWHRLPHFTAKSFAGNLIAMLVFGLIVAFCAGRGPMSAPLRRGRP